ncbi:CoA pyrophosphatase [Sneathiella sp. HT1-7]|jgi:8-oxo-dGTP pyrophosphatase MutT (NUDIX family)|uniref:CoA pyrophosphatase n=1 Tax=Sneathiella sp. HT1-7 TaxID=2887192 RepID=UPI001D1494D3|nr:CoA pyrophosphatase [Sneathiella sp. HT1-7]MCC3306471.1 CoA pyrophosphatase [Sneathiella sp. HT1-7]
MTFLIHKKQELTKKLQQSLGPVPTTLSPALNLSGSMRGDHDLNPASAPDRNLPFTPAAVLVPIVLRREGPTVILTRRATHLSKHAGQISFPGGRADEGDENAVATALRESQEEISLDPKLVEVVGTLTTYVTVTQYSVTPVVGLVEPTFDLRPEAGEVSEIFEVPLDFLLDQANRKKHSGFRDGVERFWYAIPFGDYYIWGATAGMIKDLSERIMLK